MLLLQCITRWPLDEMRSIEDYITGYVDGEGCFTVTFNRRPMISRKQKDFDLFATIVRKINIGEHITKTGLIDLVTLAYQMNGSGKRKRTKEEIIDDLNSH